KAPAGEGPVSEVSYLVDLRSEIREDRERLFPPASNPGMAPVRLAPLDPNLVRRELHFGVVQRKIGPEVASVEGVDRSVVESDILLRHCRGVSRSFRS